VRRGGGSSEEARTGSPARLPLAHAGAKSAYRWPLIDAFGARWVEIRSHYARDEAAIATNAE
jgi:hypothetical protein